MMHSQIPLEHIPLPAQSRGHRPSPVTATKRANKRYRLRAAIAAREWIREPTESRGPRSSADKDRGVGIDALG